MGSFVPFFVFTNQHREHRRQEHEYERLNKPHQQFHEIEWYLEQPTEVGHQICHRFQHVFTGKNVAVKPETEGNRTEENRHDFKDAYGEKHNHHEHLQSPGCISFRSKEMQEEAKGSHLTDSPNN